jgi:hypothetical protein
LNLLYLRATTSDETAPPPALMAAMGELLQRSLCDGTLVETGGLLPSKDGLRIRLAGGKIQVTDGPFTESKSEPVRTVVVGLFIGASLRLGELLVSSPAFSSRVVVVALLFVVSRPRQMLVCSSLNLSRARAANESHRGKGHQKLALHA